jgi:hypothetical protein
MTNDPDVGYRKPPKSTRFKKGKSGNAKGRPRGQQSEAPFEAVLGQILTITEKGTEKTITAEEAILQKMLELSLGGNMIVARALETAIEEQAERKAKLQKKHEVNSIVIQPVPRGSVAHHLRQLGIIRKLYPRQPHATFRIENWVVAKALERLGDRQMTVDEQMTVSRATRFPNKMKWPIWWIVEH